MKLTDPEIYGIQEALRDVHGNIDRHEFARAIEAAVLAAHPPAAPVAQIRTDIERANCIWLAPLPAHGTFLYTHPPAQDSQTFKCAMCAILAPEQALQALATEAQERGEYAAAPTEQAAVPLQIDAGKILNSPSPALIRRAGYIEGLEAAAKEALRTYPSQPGHTPSQMEIMDSDHYTPAKIAERIRALIDKEPM